MRVVAILGTYRRRGTTDQAVEAILEGARVRGAETSKIYLADHPINFCRNCRACTQDPGPRRGKCVERDELESILDAIDKADAIVLASPVNFFDVTAVTRRFIERLVGYAYWPWGNHGPQERIVEKSKKAVIVLSSAAPAILVRLLTGAPKVLKTAASLLGARTVATLFCGRAALKEFQRLAPATLARAKRLGSNLAT
jgi:FMN-dependent NADH-azoreductase